MRPRVSLVWSVILILCASDALAELRLSSIISDHMVVQRDEPIVVWGWSDPEAEITVRIASDEETEEADDDGRWLVELPERKAGGPYVITVISSMGERLEVNDVLVGEVWVCSGQSNMQWSINAGVQDGETEAAAANYPQIRLINVPRRPALEPQADIDAEWLACTPQTVRDFSAVGYFFGRKLHEELGVPIGLIGSNYGGTIAEAWTSREALLEQPAVAETLARWDSDAPREEYEQRVAAYEAAKAEAEREGRPAPPRPFFLVPPEQNPNRPAGLYNAMIAPITDYRIAGAIWYQGESNVGKAYDYRSVFPAMIQDWRDRFDDFDMPFYFVQLAPFRYGKMDPRACAELWEAQLMTMKNKWFTGMVVTTDVANISDIHPQNKKPVGQRLALWALAKQYGRDVVYSGPIYHKMKIRDNTIELKFKHAGSGLASRDGLPLSHFQIAGEDRIFHPAVAAIDGSDGLVVYSEPVAKPVAVRFAWQDTAEPNFINRQGLPASPFRTDEWKGVTQK